MLHPLSNKNIRRRCSGGQDNVRKVGLAARAAAVLCVWAVVWFCVDIANILRVRRV